MIGIGGNGISDSRTGVRLLGAASSGDMVANINGLVIPGTEGLHLPGGVLP